MARAIEAAHAEKLDEQAALLAHHWEEAGEALAAARWHRRAADWLWMRDVARSFEHFARVRTLTASLLDEAEGREHGLRARVMLLQASWRVGLSPRSSSALPRRLGRSRRARVMRAVDWTSKTP